MRINNLTKLIMIEEIINWTSPLYCLPHISPHHIGPIGDGLEKKKAIVGFIEETERSRIFLLSFYRRFSMLLIMHGN